MKKKEGAPTKYKPEYCDALIRHFQDGDSYTAFAAYCGVNVDTLYNWEKLFPEFSDAKKIGWASYQTWWENAGKTGLYNESFKDADGMTVSRNINPAIWIYNMKCRFPRDWTEKKEIIADVTTRASESDEVKELVEILKNLKELV